jgi:hypothetical protein
MDNKGYELLAPGRTLHVVVSSFWRGTSRAVQAPSGTGSRSEQLRSGDHKNDKQSSGQKIRQSQCGKTSQGIIDGPIRDVACGFLYEHRRKKELP